MAKQNAVYSLRESIRLLEIRQAEEGIILKNQLRITYESLKPINLIKNSVKDLVNSVEIKAGLFETIVSILTGYLTKKLMISSKSSTVMKLVGAFLQFGVTNLISKNTEVIRNFISDLFEKLIHPGNEEVELPETEV